MSSDHIPSQVQSRVPLLETLVLLPASGRLANLKRQTEPHEQIDLSNVLTRTCVTASAGIRTFLMLAWMSLDAFDAEALTRGTDMLGVCTSARPLPCMSQS